MIDWNQFSDLRYMIDSGDKTNNRFYHIAHQKMLTSLRSMIGVHCV